MIGNLPRRIAKAVLASVLATLGGCSPLGVANALFVDGRHPQAVGIAYGDHPRQLLDLYLPHAPAEAPLPVVLFFYGGSWKDGSRTDYRFVGEALALHGIVTVIADYRVHPEVAFPAFVEDAALALRWTVDHIADHGGDPGRIVLAGHSAGAHIAALLALDRRYQAAQGLGPDTVAGFVGLAGPYAFDPLRYSSVRPVFAHLSDPDESRPVTFAGPHAPPTLLLHGIADTTVLPVNSERLAAALREAGVAVRLELYEGISHVRLVLGFLSPLRRHPPVLDEVAAFVAALPSRGDPQASPGAPSGS